MFSIRIPLISLISLALYLVSFPVFADGIVRPPRDYKGSLTEKAQEAIIIFQGSETPDEATEDLILKITIEGDVDQFGWIVPQGDCTIRHYPSSTCSR